MALQTSHWTNELPPLAACGLVSRLPPALTLRQSADNAVKHPAVTVPDASASGAKQHLFCSKRLYDAVHSCVLAETGIPPTEKTSATLIITSVAMEYYVRSHSTKAHLLASQQARITREVKAAVEAVKTGSEREDFMRFFTSASPVEVAERLRTMLGEPESQTATWMRIVSKHTPSALVDILMATKEAFATGDTHRMDGAGSKTMGGIFFREEKRLKASVRKEVLQAELKPLPPLRTYQRDLVAMALLSWGLHLTKEVLAPAAERSAEAMQGKEDMAALQARWQAMAAGWTGNWLVSSPTNSGKTRMFVEVARAVILSKLPTKCAMIVVLVPSVILTTQHAVAFDSAQLPKTHTGAYSSDNQLGARVWRNLCIAAHDGAHASVVISTAESFVNLLRSGRAFLAEVDLLIFDEVHHCKDDHPYAHVMTFYNKSIPGCPQPRVLGVTASPASEKDMATLERRMEELLKRCGARLHLVDIEDPDVAAVLPVPNLIEIAVAMRQIDVEVMTFLQASALNAAVQIYTALQAVKAVGSTAIMDKNGLMSDLTVTIDRCTPTVDRQRIITRLDPLGQWLSGAREFATKYKCPNVDLAARLLDIIRKAIELVEDAGFEGSLPFLGRKAAVLCGQELTAQGGSIAGLRRNPTVPPCPPTKVRKTMFAEALAVSEAAAAAAGLNTAAADVYDAPSTIGGVSGLPAVERLLFAAGSGAAAAAALPAVKDTAMPLAAASRGSSEPGNRCQDVPLRVSTLLKELLPLAQMWDGNCTACDSNDLVADSFVSGELQKDKTFPKFWALMEYLQRYREKNNFHGIVFVRTRQAVFHVTDMIRRTAQLQFLEVLELIGHSRTTKRTALSAEDDRHGRGMSDSQQQQVLHLFKEAGRKVLVATSAAEEGLDVPACEFVVRYNAAVTGIQLLQSRGRARQKVAEFCVILQEGTMDTSLHVKSRLEENNMQMWRRVEATRGSARRIATQDPMA